MLLLHVLGVPVLKLVPKEIRVGRLVELVLRLVWTSLWSVNSEKELIIGVDQLVKIVCSAEAKLG